MSNALGGLLSKITIGKPHKPQTTTTSSGIQTGETPLLGRRVSKGTGTTPKFQKELFRTIQQSLQQPPKTQQTLSKKASSDVPPRAIPTTRNTRLIPPTKVLTPSKIETAKKPLSKEFSPIMNMNLSSDKIQSIINKCKEDIENNVSSVEQATKLLVDLAFNSRSPVRQEALNALYALNASPKVKAGHKANIYFLMEKANKKK